MGQTRCQPVSCGGRLQHQLGAAMHDKIRRPEHAGAERLDDEFQDRGDEAVGRLARISAKRFSMVLKPLAMHHSSAAKSACWRPSSCERFNAAESR